uniref:Synapsin_C domain-containing protein n=1 Tax=Angiostrongylus cantonensis TaxID=6313 RepID=A0A0K0DDY1_ANGCA
MCSSAPTSPARSTETLAAAVERSLQNDRSRAAPVMPPNAKADFPELDLLCTEHSLTVEINQTGRDPRNFCPHAAFVGPSATRNQQSKTILRAMIAAGIPFVNSHTSMIAFMDKNNLKKQLRKLVLADNTRIPLLPTIHYPHFHRFHEPTTFPVVISVKEGYQGIGKIKVNSQAELSDVEGMLQIMGKGDTEVEVEPYVDIKFDLHVQKIGHEMKTFLRRGISKSWKSNVGSAVLEQIPTNERFVLDISCSIIIKNFVVL